MWLASLTVTSTRLFRSRVWTVITGDRSMLRMTDFARSSLRWNAIRFAHIAARFAIIACLTELLVCFLKWTRFLRRTPHPCSFSTLYDRIPTRSRTIAFSRHWSICLVLFSPCLPHSTLASPSHRDCSYCACFSLFCCFRSSTSVCTCGFSRVLAIGRLFRSLRPNNCWAGELFIPMVGYSSRPKDSCRSPLLLVLCFSTVVLPAWLRFLPCHCFSGIPERLVVCVNA